MKHLTQFTGARTLLAAAAFFAAPTLAQVQPSTLTIDLEPIVTTDLSAPVFLTHAGDGSGRLFIIDQIGLIRIVENGVLLPTPFLDIRPVMVTLNAGFDERGLLGLAFHPDYTNNGRFFIRYSAPRAGQVGEPCFGTSRGCHEEILAEYTVSANPNIANPNGTILFRIDEPEFNHNAGQVMFGPDGYLYFSLGDGGGANDGLHLPSLPHGPIGNGQNIETALGSMLRIDVDGAFPYEIPQDNPFVGGPGLDEIWAYGFRNPYRFSFDDGPGGNGWMYLADVGQIRLEEINVVHNGGNYGWAIKEGTTCFDPFNPGTPPPICNSAGLIDPIAEYGRSDGIAVVGGFVYRGSVFRELYGKYVFGDWSLSFAQPQGNLYFIDLNFPSVIRRFRITANNVALGRYLLGVGRDEDGEIYIAVSRAAGPLSGTGEVHKITRPVSCYADCDQSSGLGVLDIIDFLCFGNLFNEGHAYACDCDTSTGTGVCDVFDFLCFGNAFAAGCN